MGAHVNSARALVIASRSKSWHICRCQGCLVDIEPSRVLQRRFEARALGSFLGVWRGGGASPKSEDGVGDITKGARLKMVTSG